MACMAHEAHGSRGNWDKQHLCCSAKATTLVSQALDDVSLLRLQLDHCDLRDVGSAAGREM
jgi:hypothetical protein